MDVRRAGRPLSEREPARGERRSPLQCWSGHEAPDASGCHSSESIVAPGISALSWRPGGKQLTFVRPSPGKQADPHFAPTIWRATPKPSSSYPADGKEKLDLSSYQWSPRGDAILLEGENDLWLLDPQTGGLRRLTQDGEVKEVPALLSGG